MVGKRTGSPFNDVGLDGWKLEWDGGENGLAVRSTMWGWVGL
ncbi:MAG: hypothetical protein ACPG8W_26285 [Candidatus Promineifilaceae bacterium]